MRLMLIVSLLLTCGSELGYAGPARAASSPELVGLERQLTRLISARHGEYGIAALDLRNGSTVTVNGNETAGPSNNWLHSRIEAHMAMAIFEDDATMLASAVAQ